jgi:cyclopropane fatty-acyl-phospholipid synthase-like methyltransferase
VSPRDTFDAAYFDARYLDGFPSTDRFFARLPDDLDLAGKTFLDYGCGGGATVVWAAQHGARRAVGMDVAPVEFAERKVREHFPELADRVEFHQIEDPDHPPDERFDVVLSKNTFEHVADPDAYVSQMRSLLADGGELVIGFSPLWKSPWGGHIDYLTVFPWAHLIFPEDVIMAERRRVRPRAKATRFEELKGGLNRMTLSRFESVMERSGLEARYFRVNAGARARSPLRRALLLAMRLLAHIPLAREYFAFSVHSVWRDPRQA